MLKLFRKNKFLKDAIILFAVGSVCSAIFATGFALATDKYFAKAVTGVIGDYGEYDLMFQGKAELEKSLGSQIKEVVSKNFPGAKLKKGISVAGVSTYFLGLPSKYHTQAVFNSFDDKFKNLPGNAGFSIMTEPRLTVSSVPAALFDRVSKRISKLKGVAFVFKDGNNIGVILKNSDANETVNNQIKDILGEQQLLEIRLSSENTSTEELMELGRKLTDALKHLPGYENVEDITFSNGVDEYGAAVSTLSEMKRFLLAYASQVQIIPDEGVELQPEELLVVNGKNIQALKSGEKLDPLAVVVKVTETSPDAVNGLIIQGDAEFLGEDKTTYRIEDGEKIGKPVARVQVSSRKRQLIYATEQAIGFLNQLDAAIENFNDNSDSTVLTVDGIGNTYHKVAEVQEALNNIENSIDGLSGKVDTDSIFKMARLIDSVGDDFDYLAQNFGRVRLLESRFSEATAGLDLAGDILDSSLANKETAGNGGIFDKLLLLNEQLRSITETLRNRARQLDNFINNFNPIVTVLGNWRNKARDFAREAGAFGTLFTPGSESQKHLKELLDSTDDILSGVTDYDEAAVKSGLETLSKEVFKSEEIDFTALTEELGKIKNSLPQLLDEEIGNSVSLIDKYVGGDSGDIGDKLQICVAADVRRNLGDPVIVDVAGNVREIYSLPIGSIQPDVRSELYKILSEVRSVIAALVVLILWILAFILDHSLIISMLKQTYPSFLPERSYNKSSSLSNHLYEFLRRVISASTLYSFAIGAAWLWCAFSISGAEVPYLSYGNLALMGGFLGIFIAALAEKINPVNKEEIMAGLSMGLPFVLIMREIVIPDGRPGLLQILNKRRMQMR